jgi:hypothetical protein
MRLFKSLTLMLAIFFCVSVSSGVNAKILWEKELALDANTNSAPLASCLNKDGNGIIIMTVECPKGSFPVKGDNILWEIGADGNAIRILQKNADGNKVQINNAMPAGVGPGCAIASDSSGNLLTVGILSKQKDEKGQKVAIISKADKTGKTMSPRDNIESRSIRKMIPLQGNTFVLVGDKDSNGLCLRTDNQGRIIREEQFDIGRTEKFTGADWIKSDNSSIAIVGLSVKDENTVGMSGENFIVLYDPNLKMMHEAYFTGWKSMPALSLVLPKVCCLDNGNIVVLYNKDTDPKTRVWARCYTQELKLLWEKELFAIEKSPNKLPFCFDVISRGSEGFVAAILTPIESLEFYFFNTDGTQTDHIQYKGMVSFPGFNLIRANGKTIAVFKEGTAGNIKECSIKAKVIALD